MEESNNVNDTSETAAYLPPTMLAKRLNWDVFLSFRGEDTRHTITTRLYEALKLSGVRTFMDDEGMEKGDVIQPSLEEAIVDSALAVAIISPRYADSRWCLGELCKIFECGKRVVPVFYRVDPSDVRRLKGDLGKGFRKLVGRRSSDDFEGEAEIKKWEDALNKAGNISGHPCYNQRDESVLIQRIVKQVLGELRNTPEYVVKLGVGLDVRVDRVLKWLNVRSESSDVRYLGIHGTPGIGKTTLAKALFNKLVVNFNNRCFISNIRERITSKGGVLSIQNEIYCNISSKKGSPIKEEEAGIRAITSLVRENQVLVVLDDVSEADQLQSLGLHDRGCFVQGSTVVVTSRNTQALSFFAHNDELYEAEKLDESESLELFSIHALGRKKPMNEYRDISKQIVSLTGGLPLALEVFGSYLVKKTKIEWEDALIKLRYIRPNHLQDVLKLSFDGLDEEEKTVFLDISCLLLQTEMKKEDLVDALEGCDLRAEIAIGNLVSKSLLKIQESNNLWMHDQVRDMGRQIVMEQSLQDLGQRSRLWDLRVILSVLQHEKVANGVRGIIVDGKKPPDFTKSMSSWINYLKHPNMCTMLSYLNVRFEELVICGLGENDITTLPTKQFQKLINLKLLQINHVKLLGNFKYMPANVRWLGWRGCPHDKVALANLPQEIRVLDLSSSKIKDLGCTNWYSPRFKKGSRNLVVLNLSGCSSLTTLPDMSGYKHLKKLILERCVSLTKIDDSIGSMSSLVHLDLGYCNNLVSFPSDVTGMKALRELILTGCSKFSGLPNDVRSMKSLIKLFVDGTAITELPYLFHLTQLEVLNLNGCSNVRALPEWLGMLSSLKELYLNSTGLEEVPSSIGKLVSLEKLWLMHCTSLTTLPDTMGNLKSLVELYLNASAVHQLPLSFGSLSYLKSLDLGSCRSLIVLPLSILGLASIVELNLDKTCIIELPIHICGLKFIKKLSMIDCSYLERLPGSMGKMSNLTILYIVGAPITMLPESIGELENLEKLSLNGCRNLCKLPYSIGKLGSLKRFSMKETGITSLPESFGSLQGLMLLKMNKSIPSNFNGDLARLEVLPASFCKLSALEEFDARACRISGQIHEDFAKLSKLEILNLSYNDFDNLPSYMEGLCVLKKLLLRHCEGLKSLPRLPSTLVELNASDCYALESILDLSNLERLQELQLANCIKVKDVPGVECLKSLRTLYMGGCCDECSSFVRKRLSKTALRNLNSLSIPGTKIPEWFSHKAVSFAAHPNLSIKSVIIGVIVSVDSKRLDEIRAQLPSIVDIQARINRRGEHIFTTVLKMLGVPITQEDQLYLCRFKYNYPLVSLLREGDVIEVGQRLQGGTTNGVELKTWGIHLVFENDDDFDGNEDIIPLCETQQSVSQRLAIFFRSMDTST